MAYQRNTKDSLLTEEDVLDEPLEGEVGEPEVGADDHAGDQDDGDSLNQLLLAGPFDFLQLGGSLADEAADARARDPALDFGRRSGGAKRRLALNPRVGSVRLPLLLRAARASLRPSLLRHATRPGIGGFLDSCTKGLSRFSMHSVPTAPAAVLAQLDAVRRVPLGLRRLIVASLAVGAGEGDRVSDSGSHLFVPLRVSVAAEGLEPSTFGL